MRVNERGNTMHESFHWGRLMAKAVMTRHAMVVDKTGHPYYQCIHCNGGSKGYEYHDGEIKHKEGCPVLVARRILDWPAAGEGGNGGSLV